MEVQSQPASPASAAPGLIIIKSEGRSSSSVPPPPRREVAAPTLLVPRDPPPAIGMLGGQQVYMLPAGAGKQEHSPYTSPYTSPVTSPYSATSPYASPPHPQEVGQCYIEVVEQPEEKFRFRYKSEMQGTHGCIHGSTYSKKNKTFPTVQVHNVPHHVSTVRLRVGLYTTDGHQHHVHKVMWKTASDTEQDFLECNVERSQAFRHTWQGLGIIHTSRKNIESTLNSRITKLFLENKGVMENRPTHLLRLSDVEELKIKEDAHKLGKLVTDKLNTVVLGIEAFWIDNGIYRPLSPMTYSDTINNLKNPSTGELKICRISACAGTCEGEEEVYIFIERVKKGDIRVRFFELNEDEEKVWEEMADFQEQDVHHQYAIAFKTPRYRDVDITADRGVYFELYRPSDGAVSEPKAFRYKQSSRVRLGKRPRLAAPVAIRSLPLPFSAEQGGAMATIEASLPNESSLHLTNIIDQLLDDSSYMSDLNEPSPYDHMNGVHCGTELVPGLLMSLRSYPGTVASDSAEPLDTVHQVAAEQVTPGMLDSLAVSLSSLSTSGDPAAAQQHLRDALLATGQDGHSVLHGAIINGQMESLKVMVSMVVKSGALDILDETSKSGSPGVHLAVQAGEMEAVQLLLGSGAALDSKDRDGESVVHAAIRGEDTDILAIILEAGADPNIPSYLGKFPLHLAVERNLLAVVRQMAEHGVDLEARDQVAGRTALHLAVDRQLEEMVRYLVKEAKVDLSREDYSGTTALSFAESCRNQNILRLLTKGARKQK